MKDKEIQKVLEFMAGLAFIFTMVFCLNIGMLNFRLYDINKSQENIAIKLQHIKNSIDSKDLNELNDVEESFKEISSSMMWIARAFANDGRKNFLEVKGIND